MGKRLLAAMLKRTKPMSAAALPVASAGAAAPNKTVVFGMVERGGDLMAGVVPNVRKKTLQPIVEANVVTGSTVHTDELKSYGGLSKVGFEHETVNHGAGQYVRGSSHVNSIEGFFGRV